MEKKFGIDISTWQAGFNFSKAKKEGVKFAIIRAGFTGTSNGISKAKDNQFESHYKNAKANGIDVGAYWYSCATSYEKGKSEAEFMYKNCLKGKKFEYPIAIDVEDSVYQAKAGKTAVTNAIKGFCEYLESKGYYVCIYANSNWFANKIDTSKLTSYDKWVANWSAKKPSSPTGGLWQFGGSSNQIRTNKVAGVVCDQNYAYYDYPSIMKNKGLNGYAKSTASKPISSIATPDKTKKTIDVLAKEVIAGKWGNGDDRKKRLTTAGYNYT